MVEATSPASDVTSIPAELVYQEFVSELRHESEQFRNYLSQLFIVEGALVTAVLWKSLTDLQILAVELTGVLFAATFGVTLRRSIARQRGLSRRVGDLCSLHAQLSALPLGAAKSALLSWAKIAPLMLLPNVFVVAWFLAFGWHFFVLADHTRLQRVVMFIGAVIAFSFYRGLSSPGRSRFLRFDDFAADEEAEWLAHLDKTVESGKPTEQVTPLAQKGAGNDDSSG